MIVFGVTGGIASGKSFVAWQLAELGATVLDADRHARAALEEPAVRAALAKRWGEAIVLPGGEIDRRAIADRVFGDDDAATAERRFLEGLVHPVVRERLRRELDTARARGAPAAVLDVPLLIESGWADDCDVIVFVETPDAVRQARAAERGWDAGELARREAAQTPLARKRAAADELAPGHDSAACREAVSALWSRHVRS
ncbi:MAG: dephospho-CoA kinase [Planctomycetota bacterium]